MSNRINVEVVYFKSNKNDCLLNKVAEIDSDLKVDRKGSKKQKRVRYVVKGFNDRDHIEKIEKELEDLLEKAPVKEWSLEIVSISYV